MVDKTENGEKVPSLEVFEMVLVKCNLVDNNCLKYYTLLCSINLMLFC